MAQPLGLPFEYLIRAPEMERAAGDRARLGEIRDRNLEDYLAVLSARVEALEARVIVLEGGP